MARTHVNGAEDLPSGAGSYGLLIQIPSLTRIGIARRPPTDLPPGPYFYAGSANGPGGIRARVRRHLKKARAVRWHVDRLTNLFGVDAVVAFPGGRECGLVAAARAWRGTTVPIPGFGSSDCRSCPAHLLRLPNGLRTDDLAKPSRLADLAKAAKSHGAIVWLKPGADKQRRFQAGTD
ncbi:MAG TPA: DUF123 domain-containing protein [Rhodospirillales bacterium]|nr:DUF123 domain-containing protein [Rhodospirillales bacterium]